MLRAIALRILVIAALPVVFRWPYAGTLFYLWYSHARPNDFMWPGYEFDKGATLIALSLIFGYVLFEMRRSPLRLRGLKLLPALLLWMGLSTLLAADLSLAFWKFSQFVHIFAMTFLVAAMANSESRVRTLLLVIGASVGLLGTKGAFDLIITAGQTRLRGPGGLMLDENEYALVLNMAIPILFYLGKLEARRWRRLALKGMALGCAIAVVGTRSRSGFLGLIVVGLLLTLYSRRKVLGIAGLALGAMLIVYYAPRKAITRYESISTAAENDQSAIGRLQAWETGWNMIKAHPFFGVGPFNFYETFSQYSDYTPRAPHNAYVGMAAEAGVPCLLLFLAIIGSTIARMWWLRRKLERSPGNEELATYCLIIQTAIIAYLLPNMFVNRQNLDLMYHLVGISAGLAIVVKQRLAEQAQAEPAEAVAPDLGWAEANA